MKRILLTLLAVASPILLLAQISSPPDTPIDGGLSWLLVAGGAFGVKKYLDHRKNNS